MDCRLCIDFVNLNLDQSVTNIFEYSNIQIFLIRIFIRVFVPIIFRIRIYSDIRSCQKCSYEYIRIFVRIIFLIRIYSDICSCQNPYECHTLHWTAFAIPHSHHYFKLEILGVTVAACIMYHRRKYRVIQQDCNL